MPSKAFGANSFEKTGKQEHANGLANNRNHGLSRRVFEVARFEVVLSSRERGYESPQNNSFKNPPNELVISTPRVPICVPWLNYFFFLLVLLQWFSSTIVSGTLSGTTEVINREEGEESV